MKNNNEKLIQQLCERKYNPNKEPPKEEIVFIIESKNIGTFQNFVTITGMQKSGKTTFMTAMIASAISRKEIFGMRLRLPENKSRIAYFDTEQGDYDFYKTMGKVKTFCKLENLPEYFDAFNFREDEPNEIVQMIEKYLEKNIDCGLLVVDGILDLVQGYNDEKESKKLINILKKITKKYSLLSILTLHKGKTTSNTIGHLGAMADRAAQSVLSVEKNKEQGTFVLKADYLRSADDFTPVEIYFNKQNNTWEQTIYSEENTKVKKLQLRPNELSIDKHIGNIATIFNFNEIQQYKELVQNISEIYATGINWSKECVRHFIIEKLIFKTEYGYTNRQQSKLFIK